MPAKRRPWIAVACGAVILIIGASLWRSRRAAQARYERLIELGAIAQRDKSGYVAQINLWPEDASAEEFELLPGMRHLTLLNLSRTGTTDADLRIVERMDSLQELILVGTQITDAGLARLAALKNLKRVAVTPSAVTRLGVHRLKQARPDLSITVNALELNGLAHLLEYDSHGQLDDEYHLVALDCHGTAVTDEELRLVASCKRLRMINVGETNIGDAGLVHLRDLENLSELWLTGTAVSDAGLEHLAGLVQLKSMSLARTNVTDEGIAHLSRLTNLEVLHLGETGVSDEGLRQLRGLHHLKEIYVRQSHVTRVGAAELAEAIPSVHVFGESESDPESVQERPVEDIESRVLT